MHTTRRIAPVQPSLPAPVRKQHAKRKAGETGPELAARLLPMFRASRVQPPMGGWRCCVWLPGASGPGEWVAAFWGETEAQARGRAESWWRAKKAELLFAPATAE